MKKMRKTKLSLAVSRALSAGAVVGLAAPLAYGQTAAPPVERMQRIEVTGSRIPLQTLESESPVVTMSQQDIQVTGLTSISNIINSLPQFAAEFGSNLSNAASGTSTANLRGLTSSRTLVLVNGKRLPAGDVLTVAPDLDAIPTSLIQRVDVLTGGASAVYGSDAIAGVVNFILNQRFEGVQVSWNGQGFNHQQGNSVAQAVRDSAAGNPAQFQVPGDKDFDGYTQDFNITVGGNFGGGKGNATVYFEYRHTNPILQSARDFSACSIGPSDTGEEFICLGSSTSFPGRFFNLADSRSFTISDAAGNVRRYNGVSDAFNFGPYNYFQSPDERYLFDAFAHYDVFPNMQVYSEMNFMDDKQTFQIAPSGSFFGTDTYTLSADNPLLSPAFRTAFGITPDNPATVLIGRRDIEGGGRQDVRRHTDYRVVLGAKGDLFDGKWNYDLFWHSGKNVFADTYLNDFSRSRLIRSLDVVTDPATGQPACRAAVSGLDTACVPYDIFHLGGVQQAALDYLITPGFQSGETTQSVYGLHVDSDLGSSYGVKLPWTKSGIGVALGYEHRTEKLAFDTDPQFSIPDLAGQGGPTIGIHGQYTVNEAFGEVRVPVLENQPFAQALNVNASYRYSDYSTNHTTDTYGLGVEWLPVKQARLRGTYQQAVRAANIVELFTAQGNNLFDMNADPCGPTKSATLEQCLRSGLPAGQYGAEILDNPANQYNYIQGGNPNLEPEKAKTYTFGVVLNPLPNLQASIDYWNIKVEKAIDQVGASLALQQCLTVGQFCNLIHRDPLLGTLWLTGGFVTNLNQNLGSIKTDGIDVTADYVWDLQRWGNLKFSFLGTWLNKFVVEPVPGLGDYDCAGLYGTTCGTPSPEWRHKFTTIWNTPWNGYVGGAWRHVASVDVDASSSNPHLASDFNPVDHTLGERDYIDLFGQWNINKNWTLRGGVNNIFDKDPPLTTVGSLPYYNGNTYPNVYDTLGRTLWLNVTAKF